MNCYKVEFVCTNYSKEAVSSENHDEYLDVEYGYLYVIASDLMDVQTKLSKYKDKIVSCVKVGKGHTK